MRALSYASIGMLALAFIQQHNTLEQLCSRQELATTQAFVKQVPYVTPRQQRAQQYAEAIKDQYNVDEQFALKVVQYAQKYAHDDFPKTDDILALIAVESEFRPNAVSQLDTDPAIGLTQIRAGVWKIKKEVLRDPENQVKYSVEILRLYYEKLQDPDKTLQAYNVGITSYYNGGRNPHYVSKHKKKKEQLKKHRI